MAKEAGPVDPILPRGPNHARASDVEVNESELPQRPRQSGVAMKGMPERIPLSWFSSATRKCMPRRTERPPQGRRTVPNSIPTLDCDVGPYASSSTGVSRDADEVREISRALPGRRADYEGKKDASARAGDATVAATAKLMATSKGSVARAA